MAGVLSRGTTEAGYNLTENWEPPREGNNSPARADKFPAEDVNMVAAYYREIVQPIGLIEHEVKGFRLESRAHGTAKEAV
jgi:hypothetical protein